MKDNYFKFNLYGNTWGEFAQTGEYIFQNSNKKITKNSCLPFLVFHFVVDYNLSDLELFFKLAGFISFTEEELPRNIVVPENINLANKRNFHNGLLGGFKDKESAEKFIESELGKGTISKFKEIKRKQLELTEESQRLQDYKEKVYQVFNLCEKCNLDGPLWMKAFEIYLEGKGLGVTGQLLGRHLLLQAEEYTLSTCRTDEAEALIRELCKTIKSDLGLEEPTKKKE